MRPGRVQQPAGKRGQGPLGAQVPGPGAPCPGAAPPRLCTAAGDPVFVWMVIIFRSVAAWWLFWVELVFGFWIRWMMVFFFEVRKLLGFVDLRLFDKGRFRDSAFLWNVDKLFMVYESLCFGANVVLLLRYFVLNWKYRKFVISFMTFGHKIDIQIIIR